MYENYSDMESYVAAEAPEDVKKFLTNWQLKREFYGNPMKPKGVLFWNREWTKEEEKKFKSKDYYFTEYEMVTVETYDGVRHFFFRGESNQPRDTVEIAVVSVKPNGEMSAWSEENFEDMLGYSVVDLERAVKEGTFNWGED